MRTTVDYVGLMAYLWVMSGGMPDGDLLTPAEPTPAKVPARGRRRLRVIQGGKLRDNVARASEKIASDRSAVA